jgi:hypothetical protein
MSRRYYTLACRDDMYSPWTPQFGDYDDYIVRCEANDYKDSDQYARSCMKIICTAPSQKAINAGIAKLNAEESVS